MHGTIGFKAHYESIDDEEKSMYRNIFLVSDEKHDDLVIPFMREIISLNDVKHIVFGCLPHRLTPRIDSFFRENNYNTCETTCCQLLELDRETFQKITKATTYSVPAGDYRLTTSISYQ